MKIFLPHRGKRETRQSSTRPLGRSAATTTAVTDRQHWSWASTRWTAAEHARMAAREPALVRVRQPAAAV